MKKITTLFLSLLCLFSLTACGTKSKQTASTKKNMSYEKPVLTLKVGLLTLDFTGNYSFDSVNNRMALENGDKVIKLQVNVTCNSSHTVQGVNDLLSYSFLDENGKKHRAMGHYFEDDFYKLDLLKPNETVQTYMHLPYAGESYLKLQMKNKHDFLAAPIEGLFFLNK